MALKKFMQEHVKDFWTFCITGVISTVIGVVTSIVLIDYIGWSAKLYNVIFIVPMTVFRYMTLKWWKFNK